MFAPAPDPATTAHRSPFPPADLVEIAVGLARSAPLWDPQLPRHPTARTAVELLATVDYDA
jgi:hypothetical protein